MKRKFFWLGMLVLPSAASLLPAENRSLNLIGNDLSQGVKVVKIENSETLNLPSPFTLEAWIWLNGYGLEYLHFRQNIIIKWDGQNNQRSYFLQVVNGCMELAINPTGRYETSWGVYGQSIIPLHTWTHVAGVYDGNEISVFVNGRKDGTAHQGPVGAFAGNALVCISGGEPFDGLLDEIRISNIARYTSNFAPPTSEFQPDQNSLLLMHFNEGSGFVASNVGTFGSYGTLSNTASWGEGTNFIPEPASVLLFGVLAVCGGRRKR